jgi:Domain of unknown function (DUF4177)
MQKWEYKTLQRKIVNNDTNTDEEINKIAKDGWELFYATVLENIKSSEPIEGTTITTGHGLILYMFRKLKNQ